MSQYGVQKDTVTNTTATSVAADPASVYWDLASFNDIVATVARVVTG